MVWKKIGQAVCVCVCVCHQEDVGIIGTYKQVAVY